MNILNAYIHNGEQAPQRRKSSTTKKKLHNGEKAPQRRKSSTKEKKLHKREKISTKEKMLCKCPNTFKDWLPLLD